MIKSILVVGIGNVGRMDDGAAIHLINKIINSKLSVPEEVEFYEAGCALYDMLPVMTGRKKIIIIDALKMADIPGSIYMVPSAELRKGYWEIFKRNPLLRETLFQLYIISGDIEIDFIGIVPGDISGCSLDLTDKVRIGIEKAVDVTINAVLS